MARINLFIGFWLLILAAYAGDRAYHGRFIPRETESCAP